MKVNKTSIVTQSRGHLSSQFRRFLFQMKRIKRLDKLSYGFIHASYISYSISNISSISPKYLNICITANCSTEKSLKRLSKIQNCNFSKCSQSLDIPFHTLALRGDKLRAVYRCEFQKTILEYLVQLFLAIFRR